MSDARSPAPAHGEPLANAKNHQDTAARTTPIGTLRFAAEFLEAALAADDKMSERSGYEIVAPTPVLFLIGHSLELSLKAFLLSRGVALTSLKKKFGHDLHRLMRKAKELGLLDLVKLSEEELSVIEILGRLYVTKELQYIVTGMKTYPVTGPLFQAAKRLAHAVGREVGFVPRNIPDAT